MAIWDPFWAHIWAISQHRLYTAILGYTAVYTAVALYTVLERPVQRSWLPTRLYTAVHSCIRACTACIRIHRYTPLLDGVLQCSTAVLQQYYCTTGSTEE